MLRQVQIDKDNLDEALKVFHGIFSWLPEGMDPYSNVILNGAMAEQDPAYFMVYDDDKLVGITGRYSPVCDKESAFLGWFGICPDMRRYHYGSQVLAFHEEKLKEDGYRYSRLYTETDNNDATRAFYEKNGYVGEAYECPEEHPLMKGMITVYSKSLGDWPLTPWDNKNMHLTEEAKGMYSEEDLKDPEKLLEKVKSAEHK